MDTTQTKQTNDYALSSVIYITSKALERAGYYGLRSILVLYMVGETLQMAQGEALALYGWLATIIAVTPIIGGVLGDLIVGNKWTAVIGGFIQALGAFAFCIPSMTMLYVGMGLICLGAGMYIPNVISNFGKVQLKRKRKMDGGYTLFYTAINIGAFLGVLLISLLSNKGFNLGFIASGVLLLLATLILAFAPKEDNIVSTADPASDKEVKIQPLQNKVVMVVIAIIISTLFWALYELGSGFKFNVMMELSYQWMDRFSTNFMYQITQYVVIFMGIVAVVVWYVAHINRFIKISAGFILAAMAFAVLIFTPENSPVALSVIFILSAFCIGIAELLIGPTVNSIITLNTNPKYLAIIFALVYLPFRAAYYIVGKIAEASYDAPKLGIGLTAAFFFVLGIATFVGYIVTMGVSSTTTPNRTKQP